MLNKCMLSKWLDDVQECLQLRLILYFGLGDLPNDDERMSVVNFQTVLSVGWGSHSDFLEMGNLDWLFEGSARFE